MPHARDRNAPPRAFARAAFAALAVAAAATATGCTDAPLGTTQLYAVGADAAPTPLAELPVADGGAQQRPDADADADAAMPDVAALPDHRDDLPPPAVPELIATRCAGGRASLRYDDAVGEPGDAQAWRQAVRAFDRCVLGTDARPPVPTDLRVETVVHVSERVVRYTVTYATGEEYGGRPLRVPAFLFVPATTARVPAVIVYHGHGEGKINVAERPGSAENALGRYLAERYGYVVLAPDSRTFGAYGFADHYAYYRALHGHPDEFYMARLAADGEQDMAVLGENTTVDPSRIGVVGISMGAWRALHQSLAHDAVRATVVNGLYIPLATLFAPRGHDPCQHVAPLAAMVEMEDLAGALAPGALMVQWGQNDAFLAQDGRGLIERTRRIFAEMGHADRFHAEINAGLGHQFQNEHVGEFLHQQLGRGAWEP